MKSLNGLHRIAVVLIIVAIGLILNCYPTHASSPSTGKGVWIWKIWEAENGDLDSVIRTLQAAGVGWAIIKVGDSDSYYLSSSGKQLYDWAVRYGGFGNVIAKLHYASIKVFGFHYVYGYDTAEDF